MFHYLNLHNISITSLTQPTYLSPRPRSMDPHKTSSNTSIPILAISVIGILTTAILLLSYYVFVIKCCRNWRRSTDAVARHQHPPLLLRSTAAEGRGLAEPAIRAIPTFRYRTNVVKSSSFHECAVCLNEFQEEERLRLLPSCLHVFHIDCIDAWLQSNASCPVCRAEITATSALPLMAQQSLQLSGSVVIQVRDEATVHDDQQQQCRPSSEIGLAGKKLVPSSSMGDECIDVRRAKDEHFSVQPIRRSFSMDSSSDRQLYIAVQQIMQQNPPHFQEAGSSSSAGRIRRSFFSFGHGRSLRKGVLPIEFDL